MKFNEQEGGGCWFFCRFRYIIVFFLCSPPPNERVTVFDKEILPKRVYCSLMLQPLLL